jgi:hypothetical protein
MLFLLKFSESCTKSDCFRHPIELQQRKRDFSIVNNNNVRRLAMALAWGITRAGVGGNDDANIDPQNARTPTAPAASLSPSPGNLYNLWAKYQVGIGGQEACSSIFTIGMCWESKVQILPWKGDLEYGEETSERKGLVMLY